MTKMCLTDSAAQSKAIFSLKACKITFNYRSALVTEWCHWFDSSQQPVLHDVSPFSLTPLPASLLSICPVKLEKKKNLERIHRHNSTQ